MACEPRSRYHSTSVEQVRGVLAERVVISTRLDPFLSLKALATYSGFSRRMLLDLINDSERTLPHYRLSSGGKIVVRQSEFDDYMRQFRYTQPVLDTMIEARRRERAARRNQP